jgi:hypothetical protein
LQPIGPQFFDRTTEFALKFDRLLPRPAGNFHERPRLPQPLDDRER